MEQYVKSFQRFHAGEDVRPVTSCKCFLYYLLLLSLLLSLLLLSMMTLITGFTCPPTIYFKFITKCDSFFYYKVRELFYYKVRQVLLQSATGVTKCDDYYKVRPFGEGLRLGFPFGTSSGILEIQTWPRD